MFLHAWRKLSRSALPGAPAGNEESRPEAAPVAAPM